MYKDDSILAEEVEEFFKEFDKDGDGKLDYNGKIHVMVETFSVKRNKV